MKVLFAASPARSLGVFASTRPPTVGEELWNAVSSFETQKAIANTAQQVPIASLRASTGIIGILEVESRHAAPANVRRKAPRRAISRRTCTIDHAYAPPIVYLRKRRDFSDKSYLFESLIASPSFKIFPSLSAAIITYRQ